LDSFGIYLYSNDDNRILFNVISNKKRLMD
jgi:parallel beta-helix repeat protein